MSKKICKKCKKLLNINEFYVNKKLKDGHFNMCINCVRTRQNQYCNTENGFITNLFKAIKNREGEFVKNNNLETKSQKRRCYVTREEFFQLWEDHKLKYGYTCALTGMKIIFKRDSNRNQYKSVGISVDRLDPEIGYTKENIIFVAGKVNSLKNAVTKELCIAILKAYEERGL